MKVNNEKMKRVVFIFVLQLFFFANSFSQEVFVTYTGSLFGKKSFILKYKGHGNYEVKDFIACLMDSSLQVKIHCFANINNKLDKNYFFNNIWCNLDKGNYHLKLYEIICGPKKNEKDNLNSFIGNEIIIHVKKE